MKLQIFGLTIAALSIASGCAIAPPPAPTARAQPQAPQAEFKTEAEIELGVVQRSLKIRQVLAETDLGEIDEWWRSRGIGDPHKYLLPPMLAQLSLTPAEEQQPMWDLWLEVNRDKRDLYHFRSIYDVRLFFLFREALPEPVREAYRSMLDRPRVFEWQEGGTENHISQQFVSGLALMDGSGFPVGAPHLTAVIEAWLRAEVAKYLTIGQGEFHSSIYYGYTIAALMNLYDFAETPERRLLAKAGLDWLATNMALRLSWGTAGGAESRGFDRETWDSGLTAMAWVWWGEDDGLNRVTRGMSRDSINLAVLAATSDYRPPAHLRSLARKELPEPFQLQASHPAYYTYSHGSQFWETFYATEDFTLGTLVMPGRRYQTSGTINAQYATYKLVVRDPGGVENAVVSLGGTFHGAGATGRSPGDRYLQEKGATIYQLRLNEADIEAGVPARSHLVLPERYGEAQRIGDWYVWRVENVWLCARVWGDRVESVAALEEPEGYRALAAIGNDTAWIVDVASVSEFAALEDLGRALGATEIDDASWESDGELGYTSLTGDRLKLRYDTPVGEATVNGDRREYTNDAPVFESAIVNQALGSGLLEVRDLRLGLWQLEFGAVEPVWTGDEVED